MALLFGLFDCFAELFNGSYLRSIERILRDVPPDRRRIQRKLATAQIHFEGIFGRTNLAPELWASIPHTAR